MNGVLEGHNRRLWFRGYLTLAGGLLLVAILLDLGFGYLQSSDQDDRNRWLRTTAQLIETRLSVIPPGRRQAEAASIGSELGVGVQLLNRDDVFVNDRAAQGLAPLVDSEGNVSYLRDAESIDSVIRLGPIPGPEESLVLRLLPPLFYLSIFVIVGLWLRPLLKDINTISGAAQRFAADYREPLATADETTELKGLATSLDQMAARLAGVLRSQKELIAALSHEMRTPLARLRFALAVSRDQAEPALSKKLAAMNTDIEEIEELIASMLSYARLDHPDIEMHWQNVPGAPWLDKIARKSKLGSIEVTTRCELDGDDAPMDSRLMELALSNLLVNAAKYACRRIRCSLSSIDRDYLLSVEDDGPGIPENLRETVFRAFTRIDGSRSRDTGGSGLGLAVVARIAELHSGRASVDESPELGGARFVVRWPPRPGMGS